MRGLRLFIVFIPILLGGLVALLLTNTPINNPTFVFKMDLSAVALLLGIIFFMLLGMIMLVVSWIETLRHSILIAQANNASYRRRFLQNLKHEILQRYSQRILSNLEDLETACGLDGSSGLDEDCQTAFTALKSRVAYFKQTAGMIQRLSDVLNPTQTIVTEELNIEEILQDVSEQVNDYYGGQRVTLRPSTTPLVVKGNWDLLFSAIYNLLDNALKYGEAGGQVLVMASPAEQGGVTVKIGDHGPGISAQELEHVWEDFYRSPQTSGHIEGSGLGLPLVRAIVERHQGQVNIHSQSGWGTEVTLWLPEPTTPDLHVRVEPRLLMLVLVAAAILIILLVVVGTLWLASGA